MTVFTKENPFRVIWKIKNYNLLFHGVCIMSSEFKTRISVEEKWVLAYELLNYGVLNSLKLICSEYVGEGKQVPVHFKFEIIGIACDSLTSETKVVTVKKGEVCAWRQRNPLYLDSVTVEQRSTFLKEDCLTVQISMWGDFSDITAFTGILLSTEIVSENCTLMWNVCNFSSCKSNSKLIKFPQNDVFLITLISCDDDEIKITICKVEIVKLACDKILRCGIRLLDSSGCERDFRAEEHDFINTDKAIWNFPAFIKKSKLTDEPNKFLVNDVLSLHCTFALSTPALKHDFAEYHYGKSVNISAAGDCLNKGYVWDSMKDSSPLNMLQKDLQLLYSSRKMTDVTIRIGDSTLLAHKCVLVARSPVFSAMFEQEMSEKKNGSLDILDIDYDTFDTMLMFMYGAKVEDLNFERARKLMVAADKYQILSLKEECSIFLKSIISDETVCEILTLSDMIQDERLIASSVDHIKSNTKNIVQSEEWKQLTKTNSRLAAEVLTRLVLDN